MKISKLIIAFLSVILFGKFTVAQTVTIDGNAFLENQTVHDSILVLFERTVPSSFFDSTYTDMSGHYNINIPTGIYNITYKKIDFITILIAGQPLYVNTTLTDTTLESIGLYGNLKGTLMPGTYKVGGKIFVQSSDTLIISPGVVLRFKENTSFEINGLLLAEGNVNDSIIFTKYDTLNWYGIKFINANSNSKLSYCLVEHSDSTGVRIINSSPYLHNLVLSNNNYYAPGIGYDGGGGIYFNNSFSILDSAVIKDNTGNYGIAVFCISGNPTIKNTMIKNNHGFYGSSAVRLAYSTRLTIISTTIIDNFSLGSNYCEGVQCGGNSNLKVINCLIANNSANGIAAFSNDTVSIFSSTITNNLISGISFDNAPLFVTNSVISNNGYGITASIFVNTQAHVTYSDIYNLPGNFSQSDPWLGVNVNVNANGDSCDAYNNINADPLFADTTNRNYHLLNGSPCIDAGINDSVICSNDLDNYIRIFDGDNDGDTIVDMGVYEYGSISAGLANAQKIITNIVKMYPNPSNNYINIEIRNENKENIELEILNTNCQVLFSKQMKSNKAQIDISNYRSGIYLIKLSAKNSLWTGKLIKY